MSQKNNIKENIQQKIKLLDKRQIKKMLCDSSKEINKINEQHNIISD